MNSQIQIFNNPQFGEVRTTLNENKEPLFCLADVCKVLDISNAGNVKQRLSQKGIRNMDTPTTGGVQSMTYINEANLYKCIFQSRKPDAEKFQDWVCDEVLPTIRRTGGYMAAKATDTPEDILARAVVIASDTIGRQKQRIAEQSKLLEQRDRTISRLKPKADFADTAFTSDTLVTIGQAAKILKLPFGRNTLFKKLRERGVLFKNTNEPKQRYVDARYFDLVEGRPIPRSDGSILIPVIVYCTQRGLAFINRLFGGDRTEPRSARIEKI